MISYYQYDSNDRRELIGMIKLYIYEKNIITNNILLLNILSILVIILLCLIFINPILLNYKKRLIKNLSISYYGSSLFVKKLDIYKLLCNKIYWAYVCKKLNLNHPKIYGYFNNNNFIIKNKIQSNVNYVIKTLFGIQGLNIKLIKGKNLLDKNERLKLVKNKYYYMIQEKLNDCIYNGSRIFRIVTLYNDESLILFEVKNEKNLTTNMSHNIDICNLNKNNNLSKLELREIKILLNKLKIIHKKYFNSIFHIAWDIMINCKNKNNIKYYILEGNILGSIIFKKQKIITKNQEDQIIDIIRKKYKIYDKNLKEFKVQFEYLKNRNLLDIDI